MPSPMRTLLSMAASGRSGPIDTDDATIVPTTFASCFWFQISSHALRRLRARGCASRRALRGGGGGRGVVGLEREEGTGRRARRVDRVRRRRITRRWGL